MYEPAFIRTQKGHPLNYSHHIYFNLAHGGLCCGFLFSFSVT